MAPHSNSLAWKIPWTEEPGGLQSMGLLGVGHDRVTSLSLFTFIHWRRKWQPTPVFFPGESQGQGSLVGCRLWGRKELDDWSDLAAAATALHDPMDCSLPRSSVHGIFQARILEWVAISSSRGPSRLRDQTQVSCTSWIARWILYPWATWEGQDRHIHTIICKTDNQQGPTV